MTMTSSKIQMVNIKD